MSELDPTQLKRLHRSWRRRTTARLSVGLDGVASPFNVGAIIRTAAAYRADPLWITGSTTDPAHPKVAKTALGTQRLVRVQRCGGGAELVESAHRAGFRVVALELATGAVPLPEVDLLGDCCLIVGHEDHGVSRGSLTAADVVAYLPQLGRVGSLNVATAASIAIFEWARQQWAGARGVEGSVEPGRPGAPPERAPYGDLPGT